MTSSIALLCLVFIQILLLSQKKLAEAQECQGTNQTTATKATTTIIVKIGGSCLTDKAKKETLNPQMLDWFSRTVAKVRHETTSSRQRYILVHGAGSYGHFTAKEYGIGKMSAEPFVRPDQQPYVMKGVAETRRSVQALNQLVVTSLLSFNVPAVSLSPLSLGLLCPSTTETIREYQTALQRLVTMTLDAGLVPVLHGDACLYGPYGAAVLGGDALMELVEADHAVFLTDVKGIYTSNPHTDLDATLVERIEIDSDGNLKTAGITASGSHHKHDVTGGLSGKLKSAIEIVRKGTSVVIVECGSQSAEQAMRGVTIDVGTTIVQVEEQII